VFGRAETRVLIAGLVLVLALAGLAGLASEIREGDVFAVDHTVLLAFREPGHLDIPVGPRWLQESARDITALGGFTVLTLVSLVSTVILLLHGRRAQALVFLATVLVAEAAASALKAFVDRPRPDLVPHHDLVYSASFPSGHAAMTPVVYLTLAVIVAAGEHRRALKVLLLVCAGLLSVLVGISRVYLGVHWPTDVLGGWALGVAVALAASLVLQRVAGVRD
jgi:undecaprenyl-diphosphatase